MKTIKIDVDVTSMSIVPNGNSFMKAEIEIDHADIITILNEIDIAEIIEHYGFEKLIDEMDSDETKTYINL